MQRPVLSTRPAFHALASHYVEAGKWQMRALFTQDPARFDRLSLEAAGLLHDYSKNRGDTTTMRLLADLARDSGVEQKRDAMFAGEKINTTEQRAVLHTALRAPRGETLMVDGQNVIQEVHAVLDRIHAFSERVRSGQWCGRSGKPITDIVNIGIGGSDLGPKMACL